MFCENCGQPMDEGSTFCGSCGNKIEAEEVTNQTKARLANDHFCENCGQPMDEGSTFCGSCGNKIEAEEPANQIQTSETPEPIKKFPIPLNMKTIVIAALVIVLAIGGVFAWQMMNGRDGDKQPPPVVMVEVPNFSYMTQYSAETTIKEAGLKVGAITNENHDSVPAGSVISQNLPPGTSVAGGTAVDLFVSSGPVYVPDVTGMAQYSAESAIKEAGLKVGTISKGNHDSVPEGSVISQSLTPGISVAKGTEVDLRVSSGRGSRPVDGGGVAPPSVVTNPPPKPPPTVTPSGPTPEQIKKQLDELIALRNPPKTTPTPQNTTTGATNPKPASQVVSVNLTAGTPINVITSSSISTENSQTGEGFDAVLNEDVAFDGRVVARRGSTVKGVIAESDPGGRVRGVASISLRLTGLTLTDGRIVSITTNNHITEASSSVGKDVAKTGVGAGIGAAIGAIAGGGRGAAIGAAIGGAGGAATALATRGDPAVIAPETPITFNLTLPLNVLLK